MRGGPAVRPRPEAEATVDRRCLCNAFTADVVRYLLSA